MMKMTPEHEELQRTVRQFVDNEINPFVDEWEAEGIFPAKTLFKKMGDLGLLGISKPEAFGGSGLDYSFEIVAAEALGTAHCGGIPMAVGVQSNMATPALSLFGSDELRKEFLAPAVAGDKVASIAVSEPGAGSDVASIKTYAKPDGDDYVINGSKMWITNSTQADFFCVLVNTSDDSMHSNKSLVIVPSDLPGIMVGERLHKMGMRCSDTAPVFFDNVRVPRGYLIGEQGKGFSYQMIQFQEERLIGVAFCLNYLQLCIDSTIEYTKDRKAFNQSLLDNQLIHFRLAELQTELESLRALLYQATEIYIAGDDVTKMASMAKFKLGQLCREIPDACLQFWGGMGYIEETIVNRIYRDMRVVAIAGGASEVMLGIISKLMGIHTSKPA